MEHQYDTNASKFSQCVTVEHDKAFTLKPLILTSGPLMGSHVLMLEPTSSPMTSFSSPRVRFMGLTAEHRCQIYGYVLEEDKPIKISVYKRRPVGKGHGYESREESNGRVWNVRSGKWIGQSPSNMAILQVSKQIHKEAVPIAYGDNTFSFEHPHSFKAFVRGIGGMCEYVKQIEWGGSRGRTNPFLFLGQLTNIHRVKISQNAFSMSSVAKFVAEVKESLGKLRHIHESTGSEIDVVDMFQVTLSRCPRCSRKYHENHPRYGVPPPCTCHRLEPHREKLEAVLRSLLAKELEIEDEQANPTVPGQ